MPLPKNLKFKFAESSEVGAVVALLKENQLPHSDLTESNIQFIVATSDENIIGCIGLEQCGNEGLLRSFVVIREYRKSGIGSQLYNAFLGYCKNAGVTRLHLLTDTAEKYFLNKGFKKTQRSEAPECIQEMSEFSELCPASSIYMTLDDLSNVPSYYNKHLHLMQTDEESQSDYWSVQGEKMMFTHFEVPPFRQFDFHSHESEQITYVLEGVLFFEIKGDIYKLGPGDCIVIPSHVRHRVWTEDNGARAVDSWSPVHHSLHNKTKS